MKTYRPVKPVKVSINATTGRDESLLFEFEVDPTATREVLYEGIMQFCKIADHRRGERNINFMKYQQIMAQLSPEAYQAARMAVDFLYGSEMSGVQTDQPHLAPVVDEALAKAIEVAQESQKPTEEALKELEGE